MRADPWPLTGRGGACATVLSALESSPGPSIVITGPAGVGRTRMAQEALSLAEARGRPTRWAVATGAAAHVPLGALAHLLPAVDLTADPLVLLQRAARALAAGGAGSPPVIGCDDVHLLDPLSMTLLHQLALTGAVTLVLTARTGHGLPDPATPLWKDGLATRVELGALPREDVERLVEEVLSGPVDSRTGERLWRLCAGTPLYLRELLEHGQRTGRLHRSGDRWRWDGAMAPSDRLGEIVRAHVGELTADQQWALDALAAGEPLEPRWLIELCGADAVADLERRDLLAVDFPGGAAELRIARPLYAEVLRERMPAASLRLVRHRVAGLLAREDDREEWVRRCGTLLDGGVPPPDTEVLVEAARRALAALDHPLAERLARAAVESGAGAPARAALLEARFWLGAPAADDEPSAAEPAEAATDEVRARLAAARALARVGEPDHGARADALAGEPVRTDGARAVLAAAAAVLRLVGGDLAGAVRQSEAALGESGGERAAEPLATAVLAVGLAVGGQTRRALDTVRAGWAALAEVPDAVQPVWVRFLLTQAEVVALHAAGRLPELDRRAAEWHARTLSGPEWAGDEIAVLHRGWAALAAGRARDAVRWLGEALAGLERRDPVGLRPLCAALLGTARAVVGDATGARAVLPADDAAVLPLFQPWTCLSRAWLAAVEGRPGDGGDLAVRAATLAADQGQHAVEGLFLHRALRLGRGPEAAGRLRDLADRLDAPLVAHFAAHAEAVLAGSGDRLDQVSRSLEAVGDLLSAADAAAESALAHERSGNRRAAASATARAVALARDAGLGDSPALDVLAPPLLTVREEQVARLAAHGLSNQAIADRLVVSVRTVEAHLAHVYGKLGITSRGDLAEALRLAVRPRRHERSGVDSLTG